MKKTYSAKLAALLLAITIFCTLLAACKPGGKVDGEKDENKVKTEESSEKEDSLRVLVDLGLCNTQISTDQERDKTLKQFKQEIKELGGPKDIEFEYIFYDYRSERKSENAMLRDSELTRVRTEILAGAGPDVFIVACDNHAGSVREDALFKYPEQTLGRRMFLPLDGYIEKAQFMEWDKLPAVVMEAGKNEEGQQLLPLTYTMPITVFRKSEVPHEHSKTLTFYDVAKSDIPVQLLSTERVLESVDRGISMDYDHLTGVFGQIADYDKEELAFSEEELLTVAQILGELEKKKEEGGFDGLPAYYQANLGVEFNIHQRMYSMFRDPEDLEASGGIKMGEELSLVPTYTAEGGYGAVITSFAGVNRNTKRPEDAFFVLDYLLSFECQRSPIYVNMTVQQALPTHEDVMRRRSSVTDGNQAYMHQWGLKWNEWYLPTKTHEELCRLRDNISTARFRTELDDRLMSLLNNSVRYVDNPETLEKEVHRAYIEMQMMLGES